VQVVGVLDLLADRAVHARGGQRALYEPVVMVAGEPIQPGHAPDLARAYVDRLGLDEIYVADLTAIANSLERSRHHSKRAVAEPPRHASTLDGITACGVVVWLDAGIATPEDARHAMRLGATRVVVGLETLPSWRALEEICHVVGPGHVSFSLDLRDGAPVSNLHLVSGRTRADTIVELAAAAGVGSMIVLELARVGTSAGPDVEMIEAVRRAVPDARLFAGGGVRGAEDLERLADAGCDGALVATALHDGRLGSDDIAVARRLGHDKLTR
jgi:phosphoribosylformimino-5-aminoimidazole carboxamide ribotide isomerase